TKALYLSPLDALHGDLGLMSSQDILVVFSKSGETDELLQLLPFVRNKGSTVIAFSSNANSRLAKAADLFLELPCLKELCPFDLTLTTSTEMQRLTGDVLSIALMQAKGFGMHAFAENHPGGRIRRRATLKLKDLMIDTSGAPLCPLKHQLQ